VCVVCVTDGSRAGVSSDGGVGVKAVGLCVSERSRKIEKTDGDGGGR
jgi:hypothetical protein